MQKPKDLKKLRKIWAKKLKKSGFDDIEYPGGLLRRTIPASVMEQEPVEIEATKNYYFMCTDFLNTYKFETDLQKTIWNYHTEGLGSRQIAQILKKVRVKKHGVTTIKEIIKELRTKMFQFNGIS